MVFTLKPFRKNEEIYVLDPKPSWKMHYNHINVWNLLRVAYSTLFSMGFAFVPRKNFKFSISIPHSTLKRKIPLWTQSPGSMETNDHQRPEPPMEEDREEELNGGKHSRTALLGVFYHFLTKNHLGIFVTWPPNHLEKCSPNLMKWDPNQFKKNQFKKKDSN